MQNGKQKIMIFSGNSSSFSNEGINKREKEEGLSNPAEVDKDEQVLGEFDEIFSDSDSCDTSSDERSVFLIHSTFATSRTFLYQKCLPILSFFLLLETKQ